METRCLQNWEAFEKNVAGEREEAAKSPVCRLLFRGQRCASWKLQTTLEREYAWRQFTYEEYYAEIKQGQQMQSVAEKGWTLPNICPSPASDEYMNCLVHLRHQGFPSPLLDWSLNENVAAFFAFRNPQTVDRDATIFLYVELPEGFKVYKPDEPRIIPVKYNGTSVPRHTNQQTKHTVCMTGSNGQFYSHEEVFRKNVAWQDLLIKYVIPGSERSKVLKRLRLEGYTEDSLLPK